MSSPTKEPAAKAGSHAEHDHGPVAAVAVKKNPIAIWVIVILLVFGAAWAGVSFWNNQPEQKDRLAAAAAMSPLYQTRPSQRLVNATGSGPAEVLRVPMLRDPAGRLTETRVEYQFRAREWTRIRFDTAAETLSVKIPGVDFLHRYVGDEKATRLIRAPKPGEQSVPVVLQPPMGCKYEQEVFPLVDGVGEVYGIITMKP